MKPDALNVKMDELLLAAGFGDVLGAAIEGDADAQCYLGMVWKDGSPDLPVSLDQALRWYSLAAESAPDGLRDDAILHRDRLLIMIKGGTMANIIADVALQDNTDERTPLVLVLDCSGSMEGERIAALNAGLVTLEAAMKNDPTTSTRGRVMVIQFGGDDEISQGVWQDAIEFVAPTLEANGRTPTGAAITSALEAIEAQKAELKAAGIAYKRPILMLMSDGEPTDEWESAAKACKAAEAANKVTVFSIGIGDDANLETLGCFTTKVAVRINGLQFKELFVWLSASVKAVSQTRNGQSAQLSPINSWASVGTS
jgi:uncharacterized protein YegL